MSVNGIHLNADTRIIFTTLAHTPTSTHTPNERVPIRHAINFVTNFCRLCFQLDSSLRLLLMKSLCYVLQQSGWADLCGGEERIGGAGEQGGDCSGNLYVINQK